MPKIYRFPIDSITKANGNCPSQEFYDGLEKKVRAGKELGRHVYENGWIIEEGKLQKAIGKIAKFLDRPLLDIIGPRSGGGSLALKGQRLNPPPHCIRSMNTWKTLRLLFLS